MEIHTDEELIYKALDAAIENYFKHVNALPDKIAKMQIELMDLSDVDSKLPDTIQNIPQSILIYDKKKALDEELQELEGLTYILKNRISHLEKVLSFVATTHTFEHFKEGYVINTEVSEDINSLMIYPIVSINDPKAAVVFRDNFGQQLVQVNTEFRVPLEAITSNSEFLIENKLRTFEEFLDIKKTAIDQRKSSFWYRTSDYEKMPLDACMAKADKELEVVNNLTKEEYMNLVSVLYSDLVKVLYILN